MASWPENSIDQTVNILLPVCEQSDIDVFLNILRAIVSRTNIDKNPLNISLIGGMNSSTIRIQAEDIGPWNHLNSQQHQARQALMLGFWSTENFPSLGIRLCGDGWKKPQRQCVEVFGRESITPNEFDSLIFDKINLRVIELLVNRTTLARLKNFIEAPSDIAKENKIQLSKKMFSFEIGSGVDRCWEVLKSGVFSGEGTGSAVQIMTNSNADTDSEVAYHSVTSRNLCHSAKRPRQDRSDDCVTSNSDDRLTTESLRTILLHMQRDIGNLTKWFNPECSSDDASQRLYLKIISQKDDLIATLKKTADELRTDLDALKTDNANLNHQVETNAGLINALQKGVDANFLLYTKSEVQYSALQDLSATKDQTIAMKDKELETTRMTINALQTELNSLTNDDYGTSRALTNQVEVLERNLAESIAKNVALNKEAEIIQAELTNRIEIVENNLTESTAKNVTSAGLLTEWKAYGESKEKEVAEARMKEMESNERIKVLEKNLADSSAMHVTSDEVLAEWKTYGEAKEIELEKLRVDADLLREEISALNCNANRVMMQVKAEMNNIQLKLTESAAKKEQLEVEVTELKLSGHVKDEELAKAKLVIEGLHHQLTLAIKNQTTVDERTSSPKSMINEDDNSEPANENEFNCLTQHEVHLETPELALRDDSKNPKPVVPAKSEQNGNHGSASQLENEDEIVRMCRPVLMAQRFGWIKFNSKKNCRAWPGFVYAPDEDGFSRAQRITCGGYVADEKNLFSQCDDNIPESEKGKSQVKALQKFNEKFNFSFV